ncbi:MAG: hypothetical protein RMK20_01960, partial [Verrucomicrobiales bacterium]|nr:hypothetical protein [Verrucomicrobiales bacterium]
SLAGEEAAAARRAALAQQRFNVEWGTLGLRFGGGLEVEANDNVRSEVRDEKEDLIFRPRVNLNGVWRVSDRNSLNLGLGVGYVTYLKGTEPDNLVITPGSDLDFDVWIGDFEINLHSRFTYSQDATADPTASGVGTLNRFVNVSGTRVRWDLYDLVLAFNYDHLTYVATMPEFSYMSHVSELGAFSAALRLAPDFFAGLQVGAGMTDFDEPVFRDNVHVAGGPFIQWVVSDYTRVRLAAGYTTYFNQALGTNRPASTLSSFFFDLRAQNRLTEFLTHTLSAGNQVLSGVGDSTFELLYVRYEAVWRLFEKTGLTTSFSYEFASSTSARFEGLERFGVGLSLHRGITPRLVASLSYQGYFRMGDDEDQEYVQNRLVLSLSYTF